MIHQSPSGATFNIVQCLEEAEGVYGPFQQVYIHDPCFYPSTPPPLQVAVDLQRSQAKGKGKGATKSGAEVVKISAEGSALLPSGDGLGRKSAAGGAPSSSTQQAGGGDNKDVSAAAAAASNVSLTPSPPPTLGSDSSAVIAPASPSPFQSNTTTSGSIDKGKMQNLKKVIQDLQALTNASTAGSSNSGGGGSGASVTATTAEGHQVSPSPVNASVDAAAGSTGGKTAATSDTTSPLVHSPLGASEGVSEKVVGNASIGSGSTEDQEQEQELADVKGALQDAVASLDLKRTAAMKDIEDTLSHTNAKVCESYPLVRALP